jgi:hypothetical protein
MCNVAHRRNGDMVFFCLATKHYNPFVVSTDKVAISLAVDAWVRDDHIFLVLVINAQ